MRQCPNCNEKTIRNRRLGLYLLGGHLRCPRCRSRLKLGMKWQLLLIPVLTILPLFTLWLAEDSMGFFQALLVSYMSPLLLIITYPFWVPLVVYESIFVKPDTIDKKGKGV